MPSQWCLSTISEFSGLKQFKAINEEQNWSTVGQMGNDDESFYSVYIMNVNTMEE